MTMTKKELALKYRAELKKNPTKEKALNIAERICKLNYDSGKALTLSDKEEIVSYILEESIDPNTGLRMIVDSDNSDFLDLVSIIRSKIK